MTENFSLKWTDFHSNVTKSFITLRNEYYLHDVTLVTDDNQQMKAHKLVLSACSDYFETIFKMNQSPNIMLCLDGISGQDLNNCLDYMYQGEVQIHQTDLEKFLNIAQRFKLNGLLGQVAEEIEQVNLEANAIEKKSSFQDEEDELDNQKLDI